jgi:hypothetical protein
MLGEAFSVFIIYVSLYSVVLVCGLFLTASRHSQTQISFGGHRGLVFGLMLLIFALGFPPSPLFLFKLSLGSVFTCVCGPVAGLVLGLLLLFIWARFAQLVLSRKVSNLSLYSCASSRGLTCSMFTLTSLVLVFCLPLGLVCLGFL